MDVVDWGRAVAALLATIALLGLLAVVARRFNMIQPLSGPNARRLSIVESLMLDPRRKLVIVRDGATEHLLLLSPFGDSRVHTQPALAIATSTPDAAQGVEPSAEPPQQ